jgi:cysteine synthase A
VLRTNLIDEVMTATLDECVETAKRMVKEEGIFIGISGGAAVAQALKVAARPDSAGKLIVVVVPDFGERYLTSLLFENLRQQASQLPTVEADVEKYYAMK